MKIANVFSEIKTGLFYKNKVKGDVVREVYTFDKNALQYATLLESRLRKENAYFDVDDKYLMKERDIIISLKKPYRVGVMTYKVDKDILIPNNFAILRGIDMSKYSYIFVANYLERIGIDKYLSETSTKTFCLDDIRNIELPDISKDEQMEISKLMSLINKRSNLYSSILDNDDLIMKFALNKVIGDEDV